MKVDKSFFETLRKELHKTYTGTHSYDILAFATPAKPQEEYIPDFMQAMLDINSGTRKYNEIDWEKELRRMLQLCNCIPGAKVPYIIWLWGLLDIIKDISLRMDVVGKLQDAARKCFQNADEMREFISDGDCLIKFYMRVHDFNIKNNEHVVSCWSGEQECLNDLAHILLDDSVNGWELFSLANEYYYLNKNNIKRPVLAAILRAFKYDDELYITNVVDLAKNLYIAEGFRQLTLSGNIDYSELPNLSTFNLDVRNKCFDCYILKRVEQIQNRLSKDNRRVVRPSGTECYQILEREEQLHASNEKALEEFRGSSAYRELWYPGRNDVLDLIQIFIEYMSIKEYDEKNGKIVDRKKEKEGNVIIEHHEHNYFNGSVHEDHSKQLNINLPNE